jgi:hypothetical protein
MQFFQPIISSSLGSSIFLYALLSNSVSLCSSHKTTDQVRHPYTTASVAVWGPVWRLTVSCHSSPTSCWLFTATQSKYRHTLCSCTQHTCNVRSSVPIWGHSSGLPFKILSLSITTKIKLYSASFLTKFNWNSCTFTDHNRTLELNTLQAVQKSCEMQIKQKPIWEQLCVVIQTTTAQLV